MYVHSKNNLSTSFLVFYLKVDCRSTDPSAKRIELFNQHVCKQYKSTRLNVKNVYFLTKIGHSRLKQIFMHYQYDITNINLEIVYFLPSLYTFILIANNSMPKHYQLGKSKKLSVPAEKNRCSLNIYQGLENRILHFFNYFFACVQYAIFFTQNCSNYKNS